ncbi:outer membrane lipoprotein carrier protein LolA [Pseudonocardia kujensis]|uniref:LolA family protein n=1 Tax=Pseudonocardia kujensis TaxID=1128675 RepID=UPI001E5F9EC2|nr:outer membrane lipoprotein carrier protein LolA [Pseudonocardia kujensis]MCE0765320.1 outer membrane lipoprotein carrier protein LolA [Pseudonocardia kujensis]
MAVGTAGRLWARIGTGMAIAGAVGLGLVAMPAGAGAAPNLPPVSPEDLVASVEKADPGPLNGTVELDNALGLPAIPGAPDLANGTKEARVWSDGTGKGRVALPSDQGEKTLVSDGTTAWSYDSTDRTATKKAVTPGEHRPEAADPTRSAADAITELRTTSTVTVDGTAEVAGRPAYELVLAPKPTERTLLREVRIAVDSEKRIPLRLTVLATGSADPAFEVGFTDLTFGPQDPSLFTFTPPPGTTVKDAPQGDRTPGGKPAGAAPTVVGDGWDTVVIAKRPAPEQAPQGTPDLSRLGTPVSGSWGSGRLVTTAVASAILTDDGRVAAGAVPEQVLTEALSK